jgi:hypothetical protein
VTRGLAICATQHTVGEPSDEVASAQHRPVRSMSPNVTATRRKRFVLHQTMADQALGEARATPKRPYLSISSLISRTIVRRGSAVPLTDWCDRVRRPERRFHEFCLCGGGREDSQTDRSSCLLTIPSLVASVNRAPWPSESPRVARIVPARPVGARHLPAPEKSERPYVERSLALICSESGLMGIRWTD